MIMSPAGLGPENDCAGEAHQKLWTTDILSSERVLHKAYDRKCSDEKLAGRESQGAWHQDKLIGGNPPVVK
jgi:hypothetical protein